MKKSSRSASKIVWAVDPFEGPPAALRSAGGAIRALTKICNLDIHPLYVIPSQNPAVRETLQIQGRKLLAAAMTSTKLEGLREFAATDRSGVGQRARVQALLSSARELKAELIVLSTHARRGVKRLFLGSFAETLALTSEIPLLVVHPNWKRTPDFKRILFPTDFSDGSLKAFKTLLPFVKKSGAELTVYHRIGMLPYPVFSPAFVLDAGYRDQVLESERYAKAQAKEWQAIGEKHKIEIQVVVDRGRGANLLAEAVVLRSKRLNAVIALASQSGLGTTLLMGSSSRQIIRDSLQPVWVVHVPN